MTAEGIVLAALSTFADGVVVVIAVAVEEQVVVRVIGEIETNAHAVVASNVVEGIVMTIADAEVLRLRMVSNVHHHADDLKVAEHHVAARHVEGCHTIACGVDCRHVEHRTIAVLRHADEADGLTLLSLMVQVEHNLIGIGRCRNLLLSDSIRSRQDVHVVASLHLGLCCAKGGKGGSAALAVIAVATCRGDVVVRCPQLTGTSQQQGNNSYEKSPNVHTLRS